MTEAMRHTGLVRWIDARGGWRIGRVVRIDESACLLVQDYHDPRRLDVLDADRLRSYEPRGDE